MRALARMLARVLFALGATLLFAGLIALALGIYVGSWPLRRLARRDDGPAAKLAALQELAVAIAGAAAVLRR